MSIFFMHIDKNKLQSGRWQDRDLFEYLLVAHPDAAIGDKIIEEKYSFSANYSEKIAGKTKPHITIANFLAREEMESTINRWIQNICTTVSAFPVDLNNYSGFPPHTVYLRVQDPQPFINLGKKLKPVAEFINNSDCPPCKIISNPHLSIARRLPEAVYNKAMADYSQRTFHESFMLDELVLLRRQHQFDTCKTIQVFRLKPPGNDLFGEVA